MGWWGHTLAHRETKKNKEKKRKKRKKGGGGAKLSDSEKVEFSKIPPNGANFEWSLICVNCQRFILSRNAHFFHIFVILLGFSGEKNKKLVFFFKKKKKKKKK